MNRHIPIRLLLLVILEEMIAEQCSENPAGESFKKPAYSSGQRETPEYSRCRTKKGE